MKTVTLEVTQRDIDLAVKRLKVHKEHVAPGNYVCNCVLSLAGKRQFHNKVTTSYKSLSIVKKGKEAYFLLDDTGKSLVFNFDIGDLSLVKPCKVVLTRS